MSYRLMLDTNICFFKSKKDKKKFAENVMYHWAFDAREFETEKEFIDYLNTNNDYHIFFKSSFCDCPYNLVEVFENVNFEYPFIITIRELCAGDIFVATVNTDGTIEELYYTKRNIKEKINEKRACRLDPQLIVEDSKKEYTDDDMIFLNQSLNKLAKLYLELVYNDEKARILYCEYDNDDIAIYYSYDGALFIGKTVISKHELLHFGE